MASRGLLPRLASSVAFGVLFGAAAHCSLSEEGSLASGASFDAGSDGRTAEDAPRPADAFHVDVTTAHDAGRDVAPDGSGDVTKREASEDAPRLDGPPVDSPRPRDGAPPDVVAADAPHPHDGPSEDADQDGGGRDAEPDTKAPSCTDGVEDGTETGVDCGGSCPPCPDKSGCKLPTDCQSGVCTADVCEPPACAPHCTEGAACGATTDCASDVCTAAKCAAPACTPSCPTGAPCGADGDCVSGVCDATTFTCDAPSCTDGVKNGTETGVDCGGASCPACADGLGCKVASDCESGVCTNDLCAPPACSPSCADYAACGADGDCVSGACTSGTCAPPTCSPSCADKAPCGGNYDCASKVCNDDACASVAGEACTKNLDCASGDCKGGTCQNLASCSAILAAFAAAPDGAYVIDPDGAGGNPAFPVYCDMKDSGGGWTLVAKMGTVPSPGTFEYGSAYWTTGTTLSPDSTDLDQKEAMFASYGSVPFTNILAVMTPLGSYAPHTLVVALSDTHSMLHLMQGSYVASSLGPTAWAGLTTPTAGLQANCNMEGANVAPACETSTSARVRLGLVANNENDCCSPDSYVGFGGEYGGTSCIPVSESAGSMGGGGALSDCAGSEVNVQDFGYLYVR